MLNNYVGKTCPYCQFPIKQDSNVVECSDCLTPHHRERWQENGGCTTFGCQVQNRGEALHRPLAHLRAVEEKVEKKMDLRKQELDSRAKESFSTGTKYFWAIVIFVVALLLLIWVMNLISL